MNPWLQHLKKYKKAHPGISLKQAMKQAKKTCYINRWSGHNLKRRKKTEKVNFFFRYNPMVVTNQFLVHDFK